MAEAFFRTGNYDTMEHTPSGADVAEGEVVVINGYPFIAHAPIVDGEDGTLAVRGGVYEGLKDGTSGPAIAVGEGVAFIEANNLFTDVLTGNVHVGICVKAAGAGDSTVWFCHAPNIAATNDTT